MAESLKIRICGVGVILLLPDVLLQKKKNTSVETLMDK